MTLFKYSRPGLYCSQPSNHPVSRLQEEVQRLFGSPFSEFGPQFSNAWAPALDVYEDKENLVVSLEAPGTKRESFEIGLHDGVLSVAGERRFDERKPKATDYRAERFEGRFQRSVTLPKAVQADKVSAAYKDGVLTITLPIAAEAKPKQIVVGNE